MRFRGAAGSRLYRLTSIFSLFACLGILIGSLAAQVPRWEVRYHDKVSGDHVFMDAPAQRLFVSDRGIPLVAVYSVAAEEIRYRSGVWFGGQEGPYAGGSMVYAAPWLFVGTDDAALVVLRPDEFPAGSSNLSAVEHHGPVGLWMGLGSPAPFMVPVNDLVWFRDTLFIAGDRGAWPSLGGIVLALDVTNPASISEDPASVQVLYNLSYDGIILDIAVQDPNLYVLEVNRTYEGIESARLHILDVTRTPAVSVADYGLFGASRFDILGTKLVTISSSWNRVAFYEIADGSLATVVSYTLSGVPSRVRMSEGRVYITWFREQTDEYGVTVFEGAGPTWLTDVDLRYEQIHGPTGLAVGHETAYVISSIGAATVTQPLRPAFLADTVFPAAVSVLAGVSVTSLVANRVSKRGGQDRGVR